MENNNNHRPEAIGDDLADALRKIAMLERRIEFLEGHVSNSSTVNGELKRTERRLRKAIDGLTGRIQANTSWGSTYPA